MIGARLNAQVRAVAARDREVLRAGPFTAFVDPLRTLKYVSFAIPDDGTGAGATAALGDLREAFASRERNARVEYVEETCPELEAVLLAGGFVLDVRLPLLACGSEDLVRPELPAGLQVLPLGPDAPRDLIEDFLIAQRTGMLDEDEPVSDELVDRFAQRAGASVSVLGLVGGEVAGTARASPAALGVAEVTDVVTLPPFRRRGIAAALTAAVTAEAFRRGAELVYLTAADDGAERIYARAGFAPRAVTMAFDAA